MSKIQRPKIKEICQFLEHQVPLATAEKWDNVGLLCGDENAPFKGAVISIDLTAEAIQEAKTRGFNFILNHHPAIFPKSRGLTAFTAEGRSELLYAAQKAGISVYSAHTNFDQCALEAMQWLSESLGFAPLGRLVADDDSALRKLVVFVPRTHLEKVSEALFQAGAGKIGNYDSCGFSVEGVGTFRGNARTRPFLGKPGQLETAKEARLETVFPQGLLKGVLRALRASHPYEEVAYDLYRVEQKVANPSPWMSGLGYGFVAEVKKPIPFSAFVSRAFTVFGVNGALASLPHPKHVKRIGFTPGKGSSFVNAAIQAKCDVFITGETGYHDSREAALRGLQVLEVGHRESEISFLLTAEKWLKSFKMGVKVLNSPVQHILQDGRSLGSRKRSGRKVRAP
jgi:dinuclear metal center YbgI/SA1388 family protein